jgi:excisionase family DNA binding protein
MTTTTAPKLLAIPQVADRIGCSRATVYRLIAGGELAVTDIAPKGSKRPKSRVSEDVLAAYIKAHTR